MNNSFLYIYNLYNIQFIALWITESNTKLLDFLKKWRKKGENFLEKITKFQRAEKKLSFFFREPKQKIFFSRFYFYLSWCSFVILFLGRNRHKFPSMASDKLANISSFRFVFSLSLFLSLFHFIFPFFKFKFLLPDFTKMMLD